MKQDLQKSVTAFLGAKYSILKEIEISENFSGDISLSKPKQCYDNIYRYCSRQPFRYEYCLCAAITIIPIQHAIIYDRLTGQFYDPTFQAAGLKMADNYFLIKRFNSEELASHALTYGYAPMLENCEELIEKEFNFLNSQEVNNFFNREVSI